MKKNFFGITVLILTLLTVWVGTGFTQGATKETDIQKITVKGKISRHGQSGDYYINGDTPVGVVYIVNQDKKVLEKLRKSGKKASFEGHLTIGADHLYIEKIDGKKYSAKAAAPEK